MAQPPHIHVLTSRSADAGHSRTAPLRSRKRACHAWRRGGHHFGHRIRPAWNFADKAYFATSAALGDCNRNRVLVRIHCNVSCRRLVHGSFSMREALADSSANPRSCMPWNEPPTTDIASQEKRPDSRRVTHIIFHFDIRNRGTRKKSAQGIYINVIHNNPPFLSQSIPCLVISPLLPGRATARNGSFAMSIQNSEARTHDGHRMETCDDWHASLRRA
jgi:hypothetical protein